MQSASLVVSVCTILLCGSATVRRTPLAQTTKATKSTPVILEKDEGERRVYRFGDKSPFTLKVDPQNGGSQHLVLITSDFAPGIPIPAHKHPYADEILFLRAGIARVHLGDTVREVHAGATIFIPAGTWVSLDRIGSEPMSLIAIFSEPGFEDYMRDESAREGENIVPLSDAELDAIRKKHSHAAIWQ
jgi:quercetin dioxygenase-like cupin family protein